MIALPLFRFVVLPGIIIRQDIFSMASNTTEKCVECGHYEEENRRGRYHELCVSCMPPYWRTSTTEIGRLGLGQLATRPRHQKSELQSNNVITLVPRARSDPIRIARRANVGGLREIDHQVDKFYK